MNEITTDAKLSLNIKSFLYPLAKQIKNATEAKKLIPKIKNHMGKTLSQKANGIIFPDNKYLVIIVTTCLLI